MFTDMTKREKLKFIRSSRRIHAEFIKLLVLDNTTSVTLLSNGLTTGEYALLLVRSRRGMDVQI